MSYPGKLVRALVVLASEPGDARGHERAGLPGRCGCSRPRPPCGDGRPANRDFRRRQPSGRWRVRACWRVPRWPGMPQGARGASPHGIQHGRAASQAAGPVRRIAAAKPYRHRLVRNFLPGTAAVAVDMNPVADHVLACLLEIEPQAARAGGGDDARPSPLRLEHLSHPGRLNRRRFRACGPAAWASRPGAPRVAGFLAAAARSRAPGVVGVPPEMAVLACFPAAERCGDTGLQDVGRRRVV